MTEWTLVNSLEEALQDIPLLDCHTHLDADHLGARGLHDILLYHMVVSELHSAGCPSGARLSEEPGADEAEARIEEALPYLPYLRGTSCSWAVRIILRDVYGWTEPVTAGNWRRLDALVREKAEDREWPREILRRAGIRRACTEWARRREGSGDDVLQYSLEWAFFARAQWGLYDAPLCELEAAWAQTDPAAPLPVTLGSRPQLPRVIESVADVHEAMQHYCDLIPWGQVLSTAQHLSTDLDYREASPEEMEQALARREQAGEQERDVYASYLLHAFLAELERRQDRIVFQFSLAAEPLPYETASRLSQRTIAQLAQIIARYPGVSFQCFLASRHANQSLCTLARELPNFSMAGCWWHNFFPSVMRQIMDERLDMLPTNRQIGFFSDAYCVEWAYAKAAVVRKQLAQVLAGRVAQGQYSEEEALAVAEAILYESPQELLGMEAATDRP